MIYITIPAHDEERAVGVLLWKIRKIMAEFGRAYEILLLDDASSDSTPELLDRYRRVLPLHVRREEERVGYGRSLETLLRMGVDRAAYPKRDVVVTLQGDFSDDPADLVPMVKAIEGGADLVTARVEEERGGVPRRIRLARWAGPRILGRRLRGSPVSDPFSGFRAYRVIVLKKALREVGDGPFLARDGWAANVELLELTARHARRIEEVPTALRYDLHPRPSRHRILATLREVTGLRRSLSWGEGVEAA